MNRRNILSIILIILVVLFAFGCMFVTNRLLIAKEQRLLSDSGEMDMEAPAVGWNKEEGWQSGEEFVTFTAELMADILDNWHNASSEAKLHNPIDGQITMEMAMNSGSKWIEAMKEAGEFPAKLEFLYNTAVLEIRSDKATSIAQMEPYYSYWKIWFKNDERISICLYINAVTGQVWEAEVIVYNNTVEYEGNEGTGILEQFARMAGIKAEVINMNEANKTTVKPAGDFYLDEEMQLLYFKDCPLYAEKVNRNETETGQYSYSYIIQTNR